VLSRKGKAALPCPGCWEKGSACRPKEKGKPYLRGGGLDHSSFDRKKGDHQEARKHGNTHGRGKVGFYHDVKEHPKGKPDTGPRPGAGLPRRDEKEAFRPGKGRGEQSRPANSRTPSLKKKASAEIKKKKTWAGGDEKGEAARSRHARAPGNGGRAGSGFLALEEGMTRFPRGGQSPPKRKKGKNWCSGGGEEADLACRERGSLGRIQRSKPRGKVNEAVCYRAGGGERRWCSGAERDADPRTQKKGGGPGR